MRIKPYRKAHSRRGCERAIFVTRKSLTSGTKREIYSCATFVPSPRSCVAAQGSYNSERCSGTQPLIVVSFCAAFRTTAPTAVASSAVGRHPNHAQLQKWKSPAKDMGDLITWLKANPNRALVSSTGSGSPSHIAGVYLRKLIEAEFQFVPYRGGALAMQDLLAGQIGLFITNASVALPQVRAARCGPMRLLPRRAWTLRPRFQLRSRPDCRSSTFYFGMRFGHPKEHQRMCSAN
jgi:hypothetical protein